MPQNYLLTLADTTFNPTVLDMLASLALFYLCNLHDVSNLNLFIWWNPSRIFQLLDCCLNCHICHIWIGFVLNLEPYESWVSPGYHISPSFIIVHLLSFKKTENNFKNLEQNLFFNVLKLCPNFGKIIGVLPGANTDSWLLWDWPVLCWFFFFFFWKYTIYSTLEPKFKFLTQS